MSTDEQDLSAQSAALGTDRIYVDEGLTGTNQARPGLRDALAACRTGDFLDAATPPRPKTAGRAAVVAVCSSTAEAIEVWKSLIQAITREISSIAVTGPRRTAPDPL